MDKGQDMEEKKKWVSSLYMDRLRCNGMINPLGISRGMPFVPMDYCWQRRKYFTVLLQTSGI